MLALLVAGCGAPAPAPEVEQAALAAAESWLGQVDAGDYAGSWDTAAAAFRMAVTREQWAAQAQAARGPLGGLEQRTVQRTAFHTQLPGAPDGEYVVITYQTRFANKQSALETVTPMRDPDGAWRVSGYFIQ
jgi:hypothetical protein